MTYANVVFSYGAEKFISTCAQIGIDGLILPDIPFEEKEEFLPVCKKYGVDLISMIAPTSNERIGMIAEKADGVIVGSAKVKMCAEYGKDCLKPVAEYVKRMKSAANGEING